MNYHTKSSFMQTKEPWHIPRASLGSISSQSGSQKSNSNPPSLKHSSKKFRGHKNRGYQSEGGNESATDTVQKHNAIASRKIRDIDKSPNGNSGNNEDSDGVKRGSHSSQGSTDSNHSSHSASSGSFLLTAANLEQLAQIHKKNPLGNQFILKEHRPQYNTNITLQSIEHGCSSNVSGMMNRISEDTVIPVEPNLVHAKTKDVDTMSMASSTHFTVVNGMGGPQRVTKDGICSRGHQITVLILTMSLMFLIGIVGAVFMLELRAKKMPH